MAVLAGCVFLAGAVGAGGHATFTATAATPPTVSTGTLGAPVLSCSWTSATALSLSWTDTTPTFTTGYDYRRSTTSGSGYTALGTTSGEGSTSASDSPSAPVTTPRYYVARATHGTWTSSNSNEMASSACAKTIVAFAGGGATTTCNYSGAATSLALSFTSGNGAGVLATDSSNYVYVADTGNNCIRKISPAGTASFVAGGGATTTCGSTTASSLRLNQPQGVAVDSSGNVYVADSGANCIRKIDTSGNVTAVAGGGATATCGTTTATAVKLTTPMGVAVDSSGNVYVADWGNKCLRKVSGTSVTAFAGTGATASACQANGTAATSSKFTELTSVSVDGSGNVYAAEANYSCMYKFSGGTLTRVAGVSGASQGSCAFSGDPTTVTYDSAYTPGSTVSSAGVAYFAIQSDADAMHRSCVIKIASSTASQAAGQNGTGTTGNNGPAVAARLSAPAGLAVAPSGDLFIADADLIRRVITP